MSIKAILTKILKRLNLGPVTALGNVTVDSATTFDIATITLPANCKYLILAQTIEGVTSTIMSYCAISVSGASSIFGRGVCRTQTNSGQGVMTWRYVETGSSPATATVQCYGYYTTSHPVSGWIIGIPIAGGVPFKRPLGHLRKGVRL